MTDYKIYQKARKKVREKRKFFSHLGTWGIMSIFFILLNIFSSNVFWAIFPILGWGIGVALHGFSVFGKTFGEEWEQRQLEKEIDKIKNRTGFVDDDELTLEEMKDLRKEWKDSDFV